MGGIIPVYFMTSACESDERSEAPASELFALINMELLYSNCVKKSDVVFPRI